MAWLKLTAMMGIFALSLLATTFPTLSQRLRSTDVPDKLFFILKHFGTGVILSTAFVHLLQDAFKILLLEVPKDHPVRHWIGLIVLLALLTIFLLEYLSLAYVEHLEEDCEATADEVHHHDHHHADLESTPSQTAEVAPGTRANNHILPPLSPSADCGHGCKPTRRSTLPEPLSERTSLLRAASLPTGTDPVDGDHYYSATDPISKGCPYKSQFEFLRRKLHRHQEPSYSSHGRCEADLDGAPCDGTEEDPTYLVHDNSTMGRKHAIVNTLVLQAGIMIHSLIIGLTLSMKSGPEFTSLVIAICFHQLFEGLSLGVRLAALASPSEHEKALSIPIVLAIIFALSVPAGCLTGYLTLLSGSFSGSPDLKIHLTQGVTSAVSAGTLIYASGVELLAGDFLHSSLRRASIGRQTLALLSLLAGAAGMAALAAFD